LTDPLPVASAEGLGFCPARLQRIDSYLDSAISRQDVPGAAVLVARHGQIAWRALAGMRDIDLGLPLQANSICRIASMTKPVTGVAVLMLLEQGLVQLEDPISKYIPEFAEPAIFSENGAALPAEREINIRDLLTHTSGLSYDLPEPIDGAGTMTTGELVRCLGALPLVHHPGQTWTYGTNMDVLGHLVEVLSGIAFDEFLQQRIFAPLGMDDTAFDVPQDKRDRLAVLYQQADDAQPGTLVPMSEEPVPFGPFLFSVKDVCTTSYRAHLGGHGLVSTLHDYTRFAQMLLNGGHLEGTRLLGRRTVDRMATNSIGDLPMVIGDAFGVALHGDTMGLGVGIRADRGRFGGLESVGSFGWGGAFNTVFWVDPEEDLIGVVMSQCGMRMDFLNTCRTLVYQALTG
jgi:CubicO group peptidase (beta-lactamase class C family)